MQGQGDFDAIGTTSTKSARIGATGLAPDFPDLLAAAARLDGVAHTTPIATSHTLDTLAGAKVLLKCENLQRGGAFKFRGAYNCLSLLAPAARARGVVAFSSGNHAQGVALAARELGVSATIVMPMDAPAVKLDATRGYGATIVTYDRDREDRESIARQLADEQQLTVVPPFDDTRVIAGQGTVGIELVRQAQDPLDLVLVPLGGGGLLSGCAIAITTLTPTTRIIGVETETSNDWQLSLAAGRRLTIPPPSTIADGMRSQTPGLLTFPIIQQLVDSVEVVSDGEVEQAMLFLLLHLKLLVEPTGAVAVALLLSGRLGLRGERVGVVVSGGNADPAHLSTLLGATARAGR